MASQSFEVVCIDDEFQILEVYSELVTQLGYKAVVFSSSAAGLRYICEHANRISLIICDYKMPEMNGLQLLERIPADFSGIPFALISAHISMEQISTEIRDRIEEFHSKPFNPGRVQKLISETCEKKSRLFAEELELIRSFVEEARPKLNEIDELLLSLESSPQRIASTLQAISRHMHTVKGAASCVGLTGIAQFAHDFEDEMAPIIKGAKEVSAQQVTYLLMACDHMRTLLKQARDGQSPVYDAAKWKAILSGTSAVSVDVSNGGGATERGLDNQKISVSASLLEEFLESSGNLIVLRNYLLQKAEMLLERYPEDHDVKTVIEYLMEIQKENGTIQAKANEMRKVPFGEILKPLKKMIRETSFRLQKKVHLKVQGEGLMVDYNVGKVLLDSLVHMVRNAIDHGVESLEERRAAGKKEEAILQIRLLMNDSSLSLLLEDDGRGIDVSRVKKKLIDQGLCTENEIRSASDEELIYWIFHPGFSTANAVSDLSGRGVGMDMVKNAVESLGGEVSIKTTRGVGTQFQIFIPLIKSVSIKQAIILALDSGTKVALLSEDVLEVSGVEYLKAEGRLHQSNGFYYLSYGGRKLCVFSLDHLWRKEVVPGEGHLRADSPPIIIVVGKGADIFAFFVRTVSSLEELLVKDLPTSLFESVHFKKTAVSGRYGLLVLLDLSGLRAMIKDSVENVHRKEMA